MLGMSKKIDADTPGKSKPEIVPTSCCGVGEITYVGMSSEEVIKETLYYARWSCFYGIIFATTGVYASRSVESPAAKTLKAVGFKPVMEAINPKYAEPDAFGYATDPGHKTILWAYDVTTIPKRKG